MYLLLQLLLAIPVWGESHNSPLTPALTPTDKTRYTEGAKLKEEQVTFLSNLFTNVGRRVIDRRYSGPLATSSEKRPPDDAVLSLQVAELMNTLDNDEAVHSLIEAVTTEKNRTISEGTEKEVYDAKWVTLLDRFYWAGKRMEGLLALTESSAKEFIDQFKTELDSQVAKSEEIREMVRVGNSSGLRDPNKLDQTALASFLMNAKDRDFAMALADKISYDKTLYFSVPSGESLAGNSSTGKTLAFDLGKDLGKALSALRNIDDVSGASLSKRVELPDKRWYFDSKWIDGQRPPTITDFKNEWVQAASKAQTVLSNRCTGCHHEENDILLWKPSRVLEMVTHLDPKKRMPKDMSPLPPDEIATLRRWAELSTPEKLEKR